MKNTEALKLPDPLLVRYYREGRIEQIVTVREMPERDLDVTLQDGTVDQWKNLKDLGWVPKVD